MGVVALLLSTCAPAHPSAGTPTTPTGYRLESAVRGSGCDGIAQGRQSTSESYETAPEIDRSWHDPARLPGAASALSATTVSAYFTVGSQDPLSNSGASRPTFGMMPPHPKSIYVVQDDKDHSNTLPAVIDALVAWLGSLQAQ